jgi:hypothetical protein
MTLITFSGFLVVKALVLITVLVLASEYLKEVVRKVLNIKEHTMNEKIYKMYANVSNVFVAFATSIAAGMIFEL